MNELTPQASRLTPENVVVIDPARRAQFSAAMRRLHQEAALQMLMLRVVPKVVHAAELTFEATLRMESAAAHDVAGWLDGETTAGPVRRALEDPSGVFIADDRVWWLR